MLASKEQKIVVGLASYGMSGRIFHAPLLSHHRHFQIRRIVERRTQVAKTQYPDSIISTSLEDLLQDTEIELIIVNTPDQTHFESAKRCLEAGKHVVVEKPFTQTSEQAEQLIRIARQRKKILSVFQNRRWDGDFLTVRHILDTHILGRLVEYEAHYDRYKNVIQVDSWKEQPAAGGGVLYTLGSHMLDQALVLFGMPEGVTGHLKIIRTDGKVDDWYDIRLHYPHVTVN